MNIKMITACFFSYIVYSQIGHCSEINKTLDDIEVITITEKVSANGQFNLTRTIAKLALDSIDSSNRLEALAQYTAGVSSSTLNGGMNSSITIRGFSTGPNSTFINGHLDNQRMYARDLDTIESVVIEKGHASIAYGMASPGGTIQYITKQPKEQEAHQLKLTSGSYDKKRIMIDSTGKAGFSDVTYRAVLIKQDSNSFMNNVGNDYSGVLTSLQIPYLNTGIARVEAQYDELENPHSFGTVRSNGVIQYDKSYVDPRTYSSRKNLRTSLYLTDEINSLFSYKASLNYVDVKRDDKWVGFFYKADEYNLVNYWAIFDNDAYQFNAKFAINGEMLVAGGRHVFEIGVDNNQYINQQVRDRSFRDFTLDVANPMFEQPEPIDVAKRAEMSAKNSDLGFYVLDTINFSPTGSISLGARHSQYKLENRVRDEIEVDQSHNSYFLGTQYQFLSNLTVRGSIAESFELNSGQAKSGRYFKPKQALQKEIAIDYLLTEDNQISVIIYHLEQSNNLSKDLKDRDYYIESGKHYSKGLELIWTSQISNNFNSDFQYTYLQNEIEDPLSHFNSNKASNLPTNALSSRLRWHSNNHEAQAYLGVVAMGKRYGDQANSFEFPSYAKVDFGFSYLYYNWKIEIDVINVFDKKYIAASYYEDDMYQGRPREFTFSVAYNW
jgi:iron complex outermembrane receptor protein